MTQARLYLFMGMVLLLMTWDAVRATEPTLWVISQQSDFLEGDLKGVSITSDGKLILAPSLDTLFDTEAAFVYAAVAGVNGVIYAATGNDGKIFRIQPTGGGTEWASVREPGVHALAVNSTGAIHAASGPEGQVYRISSSGEAEVFFDPDDKYIWSLLFDRQDNLFVGTGPRGIIYKVTPEGEGSVFYDSKETHISALKLDLQGNLLAGTAPGGLLVRFSNQGRPSVIYDSPLQEIKSVALDRYGTLYAVGLSLPGQKPGEGPVQGTGNTADENPTQDSSSPSGSEERMEISGIARGARTEVYRVDRDGLVEMLYSSNDEIAFDLLVRSNGNLLVATGNRGRILSISPEKFVTLLAQSPEQQVTQLIESESEVYAATSNLGLLFHLSTTPPEVGIYESKVMDAQILTSWGRIRWKGTSSGTPAVQVYTRSGNTETPDQTWTDWEGPLMDSLGEQIQSPAARFLQWKMEFPNEAVSTALSGQPSGVDSVTVSFLQRNMSPRVTSVTIHPPGMALSQQAVPNPTGTSLPGGPDQAHLRSLPRNIRSLANTAPQPGPRPIYSAGSRSFSWSAVDPNSDDLVYSLYYRLQEDPSWQPLVEDRVESYYTLDGLSFSDGTYLMKVVVSDALSNPPGQALEGELLSAPFVIANTSPVVELGTPRTAEGRMELPFTARTSGSVVYQTEYSVNSGEWQIIFPEDGIADSDLENYTLGVEDVGPGRHAIAIRVVDSIGNIGAGRTTISVQ